MNKLEISDNVIYQLDSPIEVYPNFKYFKSFIKTTVNKGDIIKKGDNVTLFEILLSSLNNGLDLSVERELLLKGIDKDSNDYYKEFDKVQNGHFDIFKHYYLQLKTESKVDFLKIFEKRWSQSVMGLSRGIVNVICSGINISGAHYHSNYDLINDFLNDLTEFKDPGEFKNSYYSDLSKKTSYIKYIVEIDKEALGCLQNIDVDALKELYKDFVSDKSSRAYNFSNSNYQWKKMGNFLSNFDIRGFDKQEFNYEISKSIFKEAICFLSSKRSDCDDLWLTHYSVTRNVYGYYLNTLSNEELFQVYEDVKNEWSYYVSENRLKVSSFLLMEVKKQYFIRDLDWDESFITKDFFIQNDNSVEIREENIIKYIYCLYIESISMSKYDYGFDVAFKGLDKSNINTLYQMKSSVERLENLNKLGYEIQEKDHVENLSYVDFYKWAFSFEDVMKVFDGELSSYGALAVRDNGVVGFNTVFKFNNKDEAVFFYDFIKADFFNENVNLDFIVSFREKLQMVKDLKESGHSSTFKKKGVKF